MQTVTPFLCLLALLGGALADDSPGSIFAVLIAGSNGYWNYRHQADVSHAYHVLIDHGVKAENIITMMYDDIASNEDNPFPGKLFNQPNGVDVYEGVKIDYKGDDVNTDNFLAVLKGDSKNVRGGNGRVLKSTKNDKVFINLVDHGDVGLVAIVDDLLTVQQLNETLQTLSDNKAFGELVFYLEACESGSMFEDVLPADLKILGVTASNASESSWGTYCEDPVMGTCLGDLFSVNWMQDSDVEDLTKETLQQQFDIVKKKTDLSNVMKYGDMSVIPEAVSNFQGQQLAPRANRVRSMRLAHQPSKSVRWPSKDIPIRTVETRLVKETDPAKRAQLSKQLDSMKTKRAYHDMHTHSLIQKLTKSQVDREFVMGYKPSKVADMACHHEVVTAYHTNCFNLGKNPYAMRVAGPLNNLCELGVGTEKIVETIKSHCLHKNAHMQEIH